MNIFISTIRNRAKSVLKYRILNIETGMINDIHSRSINTYLSNNTVRNLQCIGGTVQCTEGKLDSYPIILHGDNHVKNNIPVIISSSDIDISIANYEGKIVKLPISSLEEKIPSLANGEIKGGRVCISRHEPAKTEDREQTKPSEAGAIKISEAVKSEGARPVKSNGSYLEALMQSKSEPINILNFNMQDHYLKLGVSPDVYKDNGALFNNDDEPKEQTEHNEKAYKFEIVRVEDRVELRGYDDFGSGYSGRVDIPEGVTHICERAFKHTKFSELYMPNTVVYLGDYAFTWSSVEKVHISDKITAIPLACFSNSLIQEIDLRRITSIDNMAFYKSKIKQVILEADVIQIGFDAFHGCSNLELFEHNSIQKIRHNAFDSCINLTRFNFSTVTTIEQQAFYDTGIQRATIRGEVNYLQSNTITGDIEEIELQDGIYKIAANAVSNKKNKPITWTVPKSVTNIEKGVFQKQDTVMCYRGSVAASSAILAESQIVYLDELDKSSIPNIIKKANLIDTSVEDILNKTLKSILEKGDMDAPFEIDESKVVRANIPEEILELIGHDFATHKQATDEDIQNEKVKFKCILRHLYSVAPLDPTPFMSVVLALKDTFNIATKNGKLQVLYDDGISQVYRITYVDNKFLSVNSSFIVAKTYDTLRYICMDNRYTNLMCENPEIQDLKKLLDILRPGDTIGLNNVISGVRYPDIYYESDKVIIAVHNKIKRKEKLKMNMYQALRYSSVTVKIDANNIVLFLPGNNKVIKCASLGKSVWLNEKEDTYKSVQCTIESIEDIDSNTIFDYESTNRVSNTGSLLRRFRGMNPSQYPEYIERYSHIYRAEQSMYKHAGDYSHLHNMKSISDINTTFMLKLFKTQLFEERPYSWLKGNIGKTIVEDAEHEFELADGATLRQYRAVKKTALRNKLMVGGDRKLYIFELTDNFGIRFGVYISQYDITTLVNMCLGINRNDAKDDKKIFVNKEVFDIVHDEDIIEVAKMCKGSRFYVSEQRRAEFVFAVYKPNGLYYICLKVDYGKTYQFMPIIQIGELEVALEFIENTNKLGANDESISYLHGASPVLINAYLNKDQGYRHSYVKSSYEKYLGLLKAREYCIDGISDIAVYNGIDLPEILKRCLGYTDVSLDYYKIATDEEESSDEDFEIEIDTDGTEEIIRGTDLSDDDFDISDSDLEDI